MLRSCNVELLAGRRIGRQQGSGGGSSYYIIYAAVALSQSTRTEFSFIRLADEDDRQLTARESAPALRTLKKRAACGASGPPALNSNQRLVSPAPFVVQANAHDVIGQAAVERRGQGGRRYGNRLLQLAEIHIEVFDLRAPTAAERTLDAAAGGPTSPHVIDVCRRSGPHEIGRAHV